MSLAETTMTPTPTWTTDTFTWFNEARADVYADLEAWVGREIGVVLPGTLTIRGKLRRFPTSKDRWYLFTTDAQASFDMSQVSCTGVHPSIDVPVVVLRG